MANITIPLVGIVDVAIVGHIADAAAIGGIAIGTMLFDLLYWNFGFLRLSTSGLTAQAYGRGEQTACHRLLFRGLRIALLGALAVLAIQWLFVTGVLYLVPCSAEVADFARHYFFVRIWAAPATLSLMVFKGWFIGMQNTVAPMITDIMVNVVNMLASYYLAVYTPLAGVGVAYGTLVAQYAGLAVAGGFYLLRFYRRGTFHSIVSQDNESGSIPFRLNRDLFLRSLCFMVVYVGFTSLSSQYGDTNLALSNIIMKLFLFFSYFADGFAYAGEALTGRYIGAKDKESLNLAIRVCLRWSILTGGVFTLIYGFFGQACIGLMTTDKAILAAAPEFQIWLILMPLVSVLAFMWDGIYIGATQGTLIRNCMALAAITFLLACLLQPWLGIQALYIGYFLHLLVRTLYLSIRWRKSVIF